MTAGSGSGCGGAGRGVSGGDWPSTSDRAAAGRAWSSGGAGGDRGSARDRGSGGRLSIGGIGGTVPGCPGGTSRPAPETPAGQRSGDTRCLLDIVMQSIGNAPLAESGDVK